MLTKNKLLGLAAVSALALNAVPAQAQAQVAEGSQEIHIYAGELFGDDLTSRTISGRTPKLDDDVTYGLRYGYNFTPDWGLELSLGRTGTSVMDLPGRNVDLDLTTLDVDAIRHFNSGNRFVPYVSAGVGYVTADLDRPIVGVANGPVRIEDDNGFTLNAGVGAKYYVTDNFLVRVDARYRYLDKIVDRLDDSLNTFETTLGVGFKF